MLKRIAGLTLLLSNILVAASLVFGFSITMLKILFGFYFLPPSFDKVVSWVFTLGLTLFLPSVVVWSWLDNGERDV